MQTNILIDCTVLFMYLFIANMAINLKCNLIIFVCNEKISVNEHFMHYYFTLIRSRTTGHFAYRAVD